MDSVLWGDPKLQRSTLIAISLGLLLIAGGARTAGAVSPRTQVKNLLRVITHDRNFNKRFDGEITVGVVYRADNEKSEQAAEELVAAVAALGGTAISGREVRAAKIAYESEDALAGAIQGRRINILYVCCELADALDGISTIARKRDVITVGATRDLVAKGLSFGIVAIDGKTKIVVNVSASRKEGTKFSAQLLKVAETVD